MTSNLLVFTLTMTIESIWQDAFAPIGKSESDLSLQWDLQYLPRFFYTICEVVSINCITVFIVLTVCRLDNIFILNVVDMLDMLFFAEIDIWVSMGCSISLAVLMSIGLDLLVLKVWVFVPTLRGKYFRR